MESSQEELLRMSFQRVQIMREIITQLILQRYIRILRTSKLPFIKLHPPRSLL